MQRVKLYTTDFCPFCVSAKRLLETDGIAFEEINLQNDQDLRMKLSQENNGWRTVPMIFIGDTFVGGFQELSQLKNNGRLEELLKTK